MVDMTLPEVVPLLVVCSFGAPFVFHSPGILFKLGS